MNLEFLKLPADKRKKRILSVSTEKDIRPIMIEKDFWVCWLLRLLFTSEFAPNFIFKGGTSLAKVYNAIDRFSEDIDLG